MTPAGGGCERESRASEGLCHPCVGKRGVVGDARPTETSDATLLTDRRSVPHKEWPEGDDYGPESHATPEGWHYVFR